MNLEGGFYLYVVLLCVCLRVFNNVRLEVLRTPFSPPLPLPPTSLHNRRAFAFRSRSLIHPCAFVVVVIGLPSHAGEEVREGKAEERGRVGRED